MKLSLATFIKSTVAYLLKLEAITVYAKHKGLPTTKTYVATSEDH